MDGVGKHLVTLVGIYLVVVGVASYMSQNSGATTTPTADTIAGLPSFGSYGVNLVAGGALLVFHKKIAGMIGA